MVTGWRRAFCTSIPRERATEKQRQCDNNGNGNNSQNSPGIISKFGFFSNPSTPRLQSQQQPISITSLRSKTTISTTTPPNDSLPNSPKLHCKTPTSSNKSNNNDNNSPRLFNFSNPSSPKSPSSFSFLKATFRFSKSRCGICVQSVKSGQGTAIFTAECSHVFHFPCVAAHLKKQQKQHSLVICPVCCIAWKQLPLLSSSSSQDIIINPKDENKSKNLRVYNDDESLITVSPGSLFNPIPELEENDVELDDDVEFQGFSANNSNSKAGFNSRCFGVNAAKEVEITVLPESAVVAVGRNYETHVAVVRVRAPAVRVARWARRAPIDLVTVLDVSEKMSGVKSQLMKRAMRVVITSLGSTDRLSIVAFSAGSKRLLPLRRMTANGRRSARRIVDALVNMGQGMSVGDALKKAAKVIEDRREKNPVASILILSDGQEERSHVASFNQKRSSSILSPTRCSHLDFPVHSIEISACNNASENTLAKCISELLNVVVQDFKIRLGFVPGSAPAEIAAVYPLSGRTGVFGPGSVRLGDLHAEEERELLVELKVATSAVGSRHVLCVQSSFKDTSSQEQIMSKEQALLIPRAQTVRSAVPGIQRLRCVHISTRAIAESKRLMDHGDFSAAYHLLSSARALIMQSGDGSAGELVRGLEAELSELQKRRQHIGIVQSQRQRQHVEDKSEPLTPTSAWRAAERLAKVAIMRKHMNRVSDLHGFENARF